MTPGETRSSPGRTSPQPRHRTPRGSPSSTSPTRPGPLTVTARQAGANLGTLQLAVQILDGAAASQSGAATGTFNATSGTAAQTHALSSTQSGSWLYVAVGNGDSGAVLTPVGGQATVNMWNDPASGNDGAIGYLATSGTGTQILGWTASQSDPFEWTAQEVLHC